MSGATDPIPGESSTGGVDGVRGAAGDEQQSHGTQGGTVTDTRGAATGPYDGYGAQEGYSGASGAGTPTGPAGAPPGPLPSAQGGAPVPPASSPLPGERMPQQPAQPYHPPQAYQTPPGAVRRPRTGASTTPRTRRARLRIAKADPWSVMKVSFLLSIALGICTVIAAAVLWMVMDAMGVFSTVGHTISEATGSDGSKGFDLQGFLSLPRVMVFTAVIAVIDVVLATALATLGAFIYNLSAGFVGGVEVTLAEDD